MNQESKESEKLILYYWKELIKNITVLLTPFILYTAHRNDQNFAS